MSARPEAQLEADFLKRIKEVGGRSIKLAPIEAGIPDRLVMLPPGVLYLVELKTLSGRLSPIQSHWHGELKKLGVTVHVVAGKAKIEEWIRWAAEESYQIGTASEAIEKRRKRMRFDYT